MCYLAIDIAIFILFYFIFYFIFGGGVYQNMFGKTNPA